MDITTTSNAVKRAPVQSDRFGGPRKIELRAGTVAWWEHEEAWMAYTGGSGWDPQSAEVIAARHGFGYREMTDLLGHEPTTWKPVF